MERETGADRGREELEEEEKEKLNERERDRKGEGVMIVKQKERERGGWCCQANTSSVSRCHLKALCCSMLMHTVFFALE